MNVLPMLAAGILAMSAAFFGAVISRMFWADDLKHAQELRLTWNKTEKSLRNTIELQKESIRILEQRPGNRT